MGDREISFLQEEDTVCRSLHHPSAACDHPCAAANSAKRHSPLKLQEPAPKRAAAVHPLSSPTTAAAEARGLLGYQKLTLPQSSFSTAAAAPPPLRRTLSEPVYSPGTGAITTRTPPPRGKTSESPRCGESPSAKVRFFFFFPWRNSNWGKMRLIVFCLNNLQRLKRMKERLREMEKWWNEVAAEDDDDSENDKAPKVFNSFHFLSPNFAQELVCFLISVQILFLCLWLKMNQESWKAISRFFLYSQLILECVRH